jgi:protein involved in polysaccharide export with SLBB domain
MSIVRLGGARPQAARATMPFSSGSSRAMRNGGLVRVIRNAAAAVALLAATLCGAHPASAQAQGELGAGDVLEFTILDSADPPRTLTVGPDNAIAVPLVGSFDVTGKTLAQVQQGVRQAYLDRRFVVDPSKVSLTVTSYRPIYVIGDVKTPGTYPYRARLTVEQAVGLAGGVASPLGTLEQNLLSVAKLRSDIASTEADITREAMAAARATATLAGRAEVQLDDVPTIARPYILNFEALKKISDEMLAQDLQGFKTQKLLLNENLLESVRDLGTLDELVVNQKKTIKFSQEDTERTNALLKSGLTRASEASRVERQLTADQGRLLQIYSQMSGTRRSIGELKRQIATLEDTRRKDALKAAEEQQIAIEKLIYQRKASQDQLMLQSNFMAEDLRRSRDNMVDYKVRRRVQDRQDEIPATNLTDLLPGDVVIATIRRPDLTNGAVPTAQIQPPAKAVTR